MRLGMRPMLGSPAGEYGPAAQRTERPVRHLGNASIDRRSRRIGLASTTALFVGVLTAVSLGTSGTARAAGVGLDLDQWATLDAAWQGTSAVVPPAGSPSSSNAPELLTVLVLALFASMVMLQIARDAKRYRRH
jgi:hypothetical protein